ncbi:DNA-methyltransferase [Aneurinibacillus migulanus]|uniref:DNA-methyltransferase n=1 Tax=Aneurinibacillus migulanus TaxID=47500 RepID=UPI00209DDA0F|nr:site-specific DNA-methyltransferase [Aneurinibacillus migulanus]MCP1359300.1 site-specific DNA-methyltransferase [Aneurinibacillus migulanus]
MEQQSIGIERTLHVGNAFDIIKRIKNNSIDGVITSPPYYNVRNYGHPDQLGLEKHPQEYIDKLVSFFDEVYRVLKDTGIVFLNLGDVYGGNRSGNVPTHTRNKKGHVKRRMEGIKETLWVQDKQLMMIPARLAIALQDRGWILRNKIIWVKPNAMPSSVQDRLSNTYEEVFVLVKNKKYYFDLDAIRIPYKRTDIKEGNHRFGGSNHKKYGTNTHSGNDYNPSEKGKNSGDVWVISTKPYKGPHPAVFPPELVEPMIKVIPEHGVIYDPFTGIGTVWQQALAYNRLFVGSEINPEFAREAFERTSNVQIKLAL